VKYRIRFDKAAAREIDRLSRKAWERVHRRLEQLSSNPRPPGCLKLTGIANAWRVRVGDIRVV
jgi:mRNA interferase RelE/StbE